MRTTTLRRTAAGLLMTLFTATAAAAQQLSPQPITATAAVPPSDAAKLVDELAARIDDELDQQLRVLQRKLEIEKEQAADKVKVTPTVVAGREGYAVRSADGDFQLKFRGYVQADSRFVGDGDGTSGPTNFVLRRVRAGAQDRF